MWYHAIIRYDGTNKRYWWNLSRERIIDEILVPLANKQVVAASIRGQPSLFNFASASYVIICRTKDQINRPGPRRVPTQLTDSDFIAENNVTKEFMKEMKSLISSESSRSLFENTLAETLKQIFVIMKFGDTALDSAYEGVIKPLGESFGYQVIRVDEIEDSGNITEQILENISNSELIIADLSGGRPNCYYEAGFAHAMGKEIVFSIQKSDKIHFDLAQYRFIEWETEAELRRKLRRRLDSYVSQQSQDSD